MVDKAIIVPNCKVCNHPDRANIDQMLLLNIPYDAIITQLGLTDLTKGNLSNHKKKHIDNDKVPIGEIGAMSQQLADSHERAFRLHLDNQRLRSENLIADMKLRMTQQVAICLTVMDQLPSCLDTVTVKDVLMATKLLREITGDQIDKHEVDITGETMLNNFNVDDSTLKEIGNMLAASKKAKQ